MEGFAILGDGSISRVALAEDADADMKNISVDEEGEKKEKKGRGCRKKIPKVPFNRLDAWECDWIVDVDSFRQFPGGILKFSYILRLNWNIVQQLS